VFFVIELKNRVVEIVGIAPSAHGFDFGHRYRSRATRQRPISLASSFGIARIIGS